MATKEARVNHLFHATAFFLIISVGSARADASANAPEPTTRPAAAAAYAVHRGNGFAIASPAKWSPAKGGTPSEAMRLVGDGRPPVPLMDGTLSALQIGMLVEVFSKAGSVNQQLDRDLAELKRAKDIVVRVEPKIEPTQLSDGTAATWFEGDFDRPQRGRRSRYQKLYAATGAGDVIVVTGYIACSATGAELLSRAGLDAFLAAHVRSLVLDPEKLDAQRLAEAHRSFSPAAAEAVAMTSKANDLLEREAHVQAIPMYRNAIELCPHVAAAHNGLAWALLHGSDAGAGTVADAVKHAETAVELTARGDFSALDTLAVAYKRAGENAKAIAALKEALTLAPQNEELQKRAKEFGIDGR
jgi:tetratricopeptide (TPR) repeat protein